jgi:hypothetical protein
MKKLIYQTLLIVAGTLLGVFAEELTKYANKP